MTDQLKKDEAALYDRQIRIWGVEAQLRRVSDCNLPFHLAL